MDRKPHSKLWIYFTGIVFATIFLVFLFITLFWFALYKWNLIGTDPGIRHVPVLVFAQGSVLLGVVIALFVGKLIIRPIQNISNAFGELSRGNFEIRIPEDERLLEIREMAQSFNAMAYELSHIETLRSDFVADVSHEFKTPIAAIEGYATLLQNPGLTWEKQEHYIEKILDNSRRLSSLSGSVLTLSKLENQETVPGRTEYRLDEQIRRCILILENKWTVKNIEFDMELPRAFYYGSEALLDQVWTNLIDNAVKYSPENSSIRIRICDEPGAVVVTVSDDGCGMTEDVQKHIFEKFYQGDKSHKSEGNGLGLALVRRIIELCRGAIRVESSPGNGTTFTVELPKEIHGRTAERKWQQNSLP